MGNVGVPFGDKKEVPALKGASLFDLLGAVHKGVSIIEQEGEARTLKVKWWALLGRF